MFFSGENKRIEKRGRENKRITLFSTIWLSVKNGEKMKKLHRSMLKLFSSPLHKKKESIGENDKKTFMSLKKVKRLIRV